MIYIAGDIHGNFKGLAHYLKLLKEQGCTHLLCCGDFGYWPKDLRWNPKLLRKTGIQIYFCDGNHEDHEALKQLKVKDGVAKVSKNIFYVPRGNTIEIDGKTIMFFGGANSIDYRDRTPGFDWFSEESITDADLMNLANIKVDIMITHTCPKELSLGKYNITDKITDGNRKRLSYVLNKYHPKFWYYGHWHLSLEQKYKNTMFYGLNDFPYKNWVVKFKE